MKKIIIIILLVSAQAFAELNGPTPATETTLNTNSLRFTLFKSILAYMQAQAIYDIVEHYSYLQNLNKANLHLTRKQRKDLEKFINHYYTIEKAVHVQTPIAVTCPPSGGGGNNE